MAFIINPEIRYLKCIMPIVQTKVSAIKTKVTTLSCVMVPNGGRLKAETMARLGETMPRLVGKI